MRSAGPNSPSGGAASVIVLGVDARTMGTIRETLGTEAVLPAAPTAFEDALAVIAKNRPDAVISGFDRDFDEAIRIASQITAEFPRVQLVALAAKADPDRIRAAMRAGYREFVVLPDDADLLRQAVHEANFREDPETEIGDVVTLWGSKGGVGTTFLAVNLAAELAPVNRVCVVDLQFAMGDAAVMLDLQPQQSIQDVFRNVHRLDERMLAGSVTVHSSKIHILAQPTDLDQREEVRGDLVMKTLTAVAKSYQYCITDVGSALDEASLTAATVADRIILVATPDVPAVKNTWRRLRLLERLGIEKDRIHLVLNRYDKRTAALPVGDIEANLGRKVDCIVSEDPKVLRAVNEGKLLRDVDRKAPAAKDLEGLLGLVTDGQVVVEKKPSGPLSWLFKN